ncbi:hypothetical protein M404DRAFT_111406, partial [Pisolithus tinctorius Marx 270]
DFNPNKPVPLTIQMRPSEYTIKQLETFKYVPLWYFTREGIEDATRLLRQDDAKESLALMREGEGSITLRPTLSVAASKQARYDHDLSFNDFLFARNGFLLHIEQAKWSPKVVDSFNWFFFNIETHVFRQQGDQGERVLLHYASRVRADWHDTPAAECFNIATINETLLNYIAQEL